MLTLSDPRRIYPLIGALIALGSPAGAYVITLWLYGQTGVTPDTFYYNYMTIGTIVIFAAFGYVVGHQVQKLREQRQKFYEESIHDPLTGVYNRRYLMGRLEEEAKRAERFRVPLSCLMIDIDHFKKINDTHGHPFGDEVLRSLCQRIHHRRREYDVFARYGGEEFVLLLPHTPLAEAVELAETMRHDIETHVLIHGVGVTVSIGVSALDYNAKKPSLLKSADEALYLAKQRGRNRIVSAIEDGFKYLTNN